MESIIMLAILFGLLLLRIPIYICLYFTGVLGLWIFTSMDFMFVAQTVLKKIDNFSLICIPFFIFMGSVMVRGQSATRLVQFAWKFVSWLPGGLGITSVISSGVFGAISGSAISTVVTIGGVIFPHMDKYKYPKAFSVGLVTAASILGIIIPPSIIMIICALTAGESVVRLFAAGYLPGALIMLMLSLYAWWESHRKGLGREALERFDFKGLLDAGKKAFFAILIIFVLFGGIYSGAFTVTEASVVACVLVLIVEMAIYRAIKLSDLKELLISTGVVSGALVITVSGAGVISEYIILQQIPQKLLELAMAHIPNPSLFLIFTCIVLLIVGTFMDQIGAIMILVPIMMPIARHMGIDPIHYCLLFSVGLGIGYITPPLGLLLYTAQAVTRVSFVQITRAITPALLIYIVALFVLAFVPWLTTFVPDLILGPR
ncbi:TRAP transporter large permease [Desulfosarcina ovata]|uniref:ABC transporter permease n=2 Tax=Desulfosarcina ovata TaxID=83564 RepID=A0A5K8A841_9BACT|nr:TRAP transporter large permease [Desulfosarcina ovata]BBO81210.1 ABC transporter permease [Desulfosarcina ovata subsp. sediminis]BBO88220.1 ABC transporter permease [Desulfosarcina ovata subsp. ovata]